VDIAIDAAEFQGRRLMVRTASWFRGPRLVVDGSEVKGKRGLSAVSWRFRGAPRSFVVRVARLGSSCSAASLRLAALAPKVIRSGHDFWGFRGRRSA